MYNNLSAMLLCDFYKISHREQYPEGIEQVYSTWTPRASRIAGVNSVVAFGFQGFIQNYLINLFKYEFFDRPKKYVVEEYSRIIKHTLGVENPPTDHIEYLHDLGYLPLKIQALEEGTLVPIRVPMLTIENTDPKCFWLVGYIESLASCELWQASTSATIANEYRKILEGYAMTSVGSIGGVQFQGHDFSMRGMSSLHSAMSSGAGHLLSFSGTDTIPAIMYLEDYYNADVEKELVGTSIPATEHSVQCAYEDDEYYLKRMVSEVYPSGFVSIVSDGYDFWDVIGRILPNIKDLIMARDGRVVIRPDSGDPVKIICGDLEAETELERKGAVEALWDIFGGTVSKQGFKLLDAHIGLIYGDAITRERCEEICVKLLTKGFSSTNVVYGIGSYTYQYNTRDTFGFALKSSACTINGVEKEIFKDPKTDDGTKKSLKGRVAVVKEKGVLVAKDQQKGGKTGLLKTIFLDGRLVKETSLAKIRAKLRSQ